MLDIVRYCEKIDDFFSCRTPCNFFFVDISIKVALCAKIENIPFKRLNLKSKNIPLLY